MKNLISIGRFAQLTGLSVKALRFYESLGLLMPAVVDPETGYRYYRFYQRGLAERIRSLRELDLSLDEVQQVTQADMTVQQALQIHASRLEVQIREKQELLQKVYLAQQDMQDYPVQVQQKKPYAVLSCPHGTTLTTCEQDRERMHQMLLEQAREAHLKPTQAPYTYHPPQGGFDPQNYQAVLCLPVHTPGPETHPGFSGTVVSTLHAGNHTHLHLAYQALAAHVEKHQLRRTSPWCESYHAGLGDGASPIVEIWCVIEGEPT
ncbi:MerR family transcriptional regulator [Deinococcus cellulosilyticus]|uniref:MerR family transcriptional regulator n=1 Tax=Deinococcus cellulosilyticus (strain DSM 18568 / NBRC 106333 / KACC 11606 / 5516J-15) TaxID=1223518 RepID=A0A511N7U2_DEIC1|nr:MerR family transcriptional regulator [Deinococcus cellulosilyticus]GEM48577.1 MerR family transcriptional regulator [Deinococcus cellulosilyticus NBRC 106333 = KACC 11606]